MCLDPNCMVYPCNLMPKPWERKLIYPSTPTHTGTINVYPKDETAELKKEIAELKEELKHLRDYTDRLVERLLDSK